MTKSYYHEWEPEGEEIGTTLESLLISWSHQQQQCSSLAETFAANGKPERQWFHEGARDTYQSCRALLIRALYDELGRDVTGVIRNEIELRKAFPDTDKRARVVAQAREYEHPPPWALERAEGDTGREPGRGESEGKG